MSAHEFGYWVAYFRRQQREQEQAEADRKGRTAAHQLSRQMGGVH